MKKLKRTRLVWLLTFIAIFSCQDQEELVVREEVDTLDPLVLDAKNYFENQFDKEPDAKTNARQGEKTRKNIRKQLLWEKAYVKHLGDKQGVVVPVKFDEELYLKESDTSSSLSQHTYVLFTDDEKVKKKNVEIVTTFPDSAYFASENPEKFTGLVYVEDWKGNLLKSFHYQPDSVSVYEPEENPSGGRLATCKTTVDWYTCYSTNGGVSWSCHWSYSEEISYSCGGISNYCDICYIYSPYSGGETGTGGGGSGGSDGGDSDPKYPRPEVCDDGYIPDGKGGCKSLEDWIEEKIEEMQRQMNCSKLTNLHGRTRKDQWDFYNKYNGWSKNEIIHERGDFSISGLGSQPGGPNLDYRYIEDPLNSNIIIDMRHLLVIGEYGRGIGESVELIQWLNSNESGFDDQDYYSNELGYSFYDYFGSAIDHNPTGLVDYLITFLNDRSLRNSISNPDRCK